MPIFLFTDIEGSTKKWEQHPDEMAKALDHHDALLKEGLKAFQGIFVSHTGDGIFAIFEKGDPLEFAVEMNKKFADQNWGTLGEVRIRIAIHAGEAEKRGDNYFGPAVNRTARILACGWGGQILLSSDAAQKCKLPPGAFLEDLGTHRLKDLEEPTPLFQLIHPCLQIKKFPPLRSLSSHPNNLPVQFSPFVGRGMELLKLSKKLQDSSCRLITILGPGGVGKTRLAIQTAAENLELFKDGVFFVPLVSLDSPAQIIPAIAASMNYTFQKGAEEKTQIINYLKDKEALQIFDNFEHLTKNSHLVHEILKESPKLKQLVTSRIRLNLPGEVSFPLEGLQSPENEKTENFESYSAIQLFLQKARNIIPDFNLDDSKKSAVLKICRLVENSPLGIELAASWIRVLSCEEIAEEIDKNLDLLSTQSPGLEAHHKSMQIVFESSWKLLSEEEKEGFKKLTIFKNGFQREAAEKIALASLPLLLSLADQSFIQKSGSGRYEIHEILREFGFKKLTQKEKKQVEKAHAEYFFQFLKQRGEKLKGKEQAAALKEIREDYENLKSAWEWGVRNKKTKMLTELAPSFHNYFIFSSFYQEGIKLFESALSIFMKNKSPDEKENYAFLASRLGSLYNQISQYEKGEEWLKKSLVIFQKEKNSAEQGYCLNVLGNLEEQRGKFKAAEIFFLKNLRIQEKLQDKLGLSKAYNNLGNLYDDLGENEKALLFYEKALVIKEELGNQRSIGISLLNIGNIKAKMEQFEEAKVFYQKSLSILKEIRDDKIAGIALLNLGEAAFYLQEYKEAESYYKQSLALFRKIESQLEISICLTGLGELLFLNINQDAAGLTCLKEALEIALKIKAHHIILRVFAAAASCFMKKEGKEKAYLLAGFSANHPSSEQKTKNKAVQILYGLEPQFSKSQAEAAREKIKEANLEKTAEELLTWLTKESS